jgi:hypothetical protein
LKTLLAYQPVDFRKGIDGLIGLCRAQFDAELYDGTLFSSFAIAAARLSKSSASTALAGGWSSDAFHRAGFSGGPKLKPIH